MLRGALDRLTRRICLRYTLLILICIVGGWVLVRLYATSINKDIERQTFTPIQPAPRAVVPLVEQPQSGEKSRINILNAAEVAKLETNVRCVPLKTAGGKPICIDTEDRFIGPSIANSGAWESHIWNPMLQILNEDPEMCLIDIGANIGVFTISAAALGRRVIAVEAFYENIQRMSESLRMGELSDKVKIVYNAVSDVYEEVYFWRPVDNPGGTHTLSKGVTLAPNKPIFQGDHSKVDTIYVNDLKEVVSCAKAVLKIDIEGYENKAFKKFEELLDAVDIRALFMEFTFVKSSVECLNIVKVMRSRGYVANTLTFNRLTGETLSQVQHWPNDIVWVKSDTPPTPKPTPAPTQSAQTTSAIVPSQRIDLGNGFNINILSAANVPALSQNVSCIKLSTANNQLICTDTRDKFIAPVIASSGAWEPHIWNKIKLFLDRDPEAGLIDVGANIGVFSLSAAVLGRQVVAVEPFYENIQRLSQSLRQANVGEKVRLVYNAVSDVYENVNFWKPDNNPGGTHTLSEGVTLSPNQPTYTGLHSSVGTIHLNELVRVATFKKAVMKIDIEGYENKAFKNIETLLDSIDISALFMEWVYVKTKEDCLNIVKVMSDRTYQAHDMNLRPLEGRSMTEVQLWPGDIIWVKKNDIMVEKVWRVSSISS